MVTLNRDKKEILEDKGMTKKEMVIELPEVNSLEIFGKFYGLTGLRVYGSGMRNEYTFHCPCGAKSFRSNSTTWSPEISRKYKELLLLVKDGKGEQYKKQTALNEYSKSISNKFLHYLKPHNKDCVHRYQDESGYNRTEFLQSNKRTITYGSHVTMDVYDEELIVIRRYDLRYVIYNKTVQFVLVPRGQIYMSSEGVQKVITVINGQYGIKYTDKGKNDAEAIKLMSTGRTTWTFEEFYRSDLENHAAYNRTGLKELVEGTEKTKRSLVTMQTCVMYMNYRRDNPAAESFLKMDMFNFVMDKMKNGEKLSESVKEEISLPRPIMKHLKTLDSMEIEYLKTMHEVGTLNEEEAQYLVGMHDRKYSLSLFAEIAMNSNYTSRELIDYMQRIYDQQAIEVTSALVLLRDYESMAKQMNMQVEKRPRSLKLVHDILVRDFSMVEDEILADQYQQLKERLEKKYRYENSQFEIRPPYSLEEISIEGRRLKHCVSSYAKSVANGNTTILFARRKESPDKPWITIEVNNGILTQARGKMNLDYRKIVDKDFLSFFQKWRENKNVG
ncbi:PcfJ domain-containing protein [Psychrobacillus sp. FSL K6-1464]|uniref:PcfJ domain-containing protein n=1 Tax=Psychrobacillus sp. FSL K6-1464 TaxID=2921545 RepID=UPI0030F9D88E